MQTATLTRPERLTVRVSRLLEAIRTMWRYIPFLLIFGCSSYKEGDSKTEKQPEKSNSTSISDSETLKYDITNSPVDSQDIWSEHYETDELRALPSDSLNLIRTQIKWSVYSSPRPGTADQLYKKLGKYVNNWYLQHFLFYAIIENDQLSITKIWNRINTENFEIESSKIHKILNRENNALSFEKSSMCDSSTMKWVMEKIKWKPKSKRDSTFHLYKATFDNNHQLLKFYLQNGWTDIINFRFGYYGSGDECDIPTNTSSPLETALVKGDTTAARMLTNWNATLDSSTLIYWADSIGIKFAIEYLKGKKEYKDSFIQESLYYSARWGNLSKAKYSIANGANVNALDENEENALFYTLKSSECGDPINEKFNILKLLIEKGANVNHQNNQGETPLMLSTVPSCGDGCAYRLGFSKLLLTNGADPDMKNINGLDTWDYLTDCYNESMLAYFAGLPETSFQRKTQYDSILKTRKWNYHGYIYDPEVKSP